MTSARLSGVRLGGAVLLLTAVWGCNYDRDKALREYDAALKDARATTLRVAVLQPTLGEGRSPDRIRALARKELLPAVESIIVSLGAVRARDPALQALHTELQGVWRDYARAIDMFADELTAVSLPEKRKTLDTALEKIAARFRRWELELVALNEKITQWG